jgi:acetyl-CoA C-acetyltransferase
MLYENWLQFHEKAGERQIKDAKLGLTHNLGGEPYQCVTGMTIVGRDIG